MDSYACATNITINKPGLTNQINYLINAVLQCYAAGKKILVVHGCRYAWDSHIIYPLSTLIDLHMFNQVTRTNYGITVVDIFDKQIEIQSADYGTVGLWTDVLPTIKQYHKNNECLSSFLNLNQHFGDPAPLQSKSLIITLLLTSKKYEVTLAFPEQLTENLFFNFDNIYVIIQRPVEFFIMEKDFELLQMAIKWNQRFYNDFDDIEKNDNNNVLLYAQDENKSKNPLLELYYQDFLYKALHPSLMILKNKVCCENTESSSSSPSSTSHSNSDYITVESLGGLTKDTLDEFKKINIKSYNSSKENNVQEPSSSTSSSSSSENNTYNPFHKNDLTKKKNVFIHLRNNFDTVDQFGTCYYNLNYSESLNKAYVDVVKKHCSPTTDRLVLLTCFVNNNPVIDQLLQDGYECLFYSNKKYKERDLNGIIDAIRCEKYCNTLFIGLAGSTYSSFVARRTIPGTKVILLKANAINQEPYEWINKSQLQFEVKMTLGPNHVTSPLHPNVWRLGIEMNRHAYL